MYDNEKKEQLYIRTMIDSDLMKSLDDYAKKLYIARTSAICIILSNCLNQFKEGRI